MTHAYCTDVLVCASPESHSVLNDFVKKLLISPAACGRVAIFIELYAQ